MNIEELKTAGIQPLTKERVESLLTHTKRTGSTVFGGKNDDETDIDLTLGVPDTKVMRDELLESEFWKIKSEDYEDTPECSYCFYGYDTNGKLYNLIVLDAKEQEHWTYATTRMMLDCKQDEVMAKFYLNKDKRLQAFKMYIEASALYGIPF